MPKEEPVIITYRGYGNENIGFITGHLVKSSHIPSVKKSKNIFQNIRAAAKRYKVRPYVGKQVTLHYADHTYSAVTNKDGSFVIELVNHELPEGWHQLVVSYEENGAIYTHKAQLLIPCHNQLGIISDIDDTILVSHATKVVKSTILVLLRNAFTRKTFEGVREFYQALRHGSTSVDRPFFYVSSSEWNLYDFLVDFFRIQELPKGVFLLKDVVLKWTDLLKGINSHHNHKLDKIRRIMDTYKDMHFVCIGDSGQHDAEIYYNAAKEYSGRVKAVYIRKVRSNTKRFYKYQELMKESGVEMILFEDTKDAAAHARQNNLI